MEKFQLRFLNDDQLTEGIELNKDYGGLLYASYWLSRKYNISKTKIYKDLYNWRWG